MIERLVFGLTLQVGIPGETGKRSCLRAYFATNLWNCLFHERGKRIAHFTKLAVHLPITWNEQYACLFRELGSTADEIL